MSALAGEDGAAVWQVGQCRVELASREVSGPASARVRRVTPKALAVLRLLCAAGGQVVSREALLAGVWPDSAPTDDVLTQAVTQLRKAFAAADGSTPYIETIARGGYRLLVPVLELADQAPPGGAAAATAAMAPAADPAHRLRKRRRRLRRRLLAACSVLLLLSTCVLAWLVWQQCRQPVGAVAVPGFHLLTATDQVESQPALSPDGRLVAYVVPRGQDGSAVVVHARAANSTPQLLRVPPAGARDLQPVFAPDGRQLAFVRQHSDGRCQVLLAAWPGRGPERELLRCDGAALPGFDFTADGRALVFGGGAQAGGPEGIALLPLDTLQWQRLDYPRQPGDRDQQPRVSPDGRWIAFVRNPELGRVYRMPLAGGELSALDDELSEVRGLAWLADSRGLLVARWDGMDMQVRQLGDGPALPAALPGAWPASARRAPVVAFVHRHVRTGLGVATGNGPPQPLYRSSGSELAPTLSADGRRLALYSDRGGQPGLWLGSADGSAPLRVVSGLQPDIQQPPDWSEDGSHLLVVARQGRQPRSLYEVEVASGRGRRLELPGGEPLQAVYAGSRDRLLVLARGNDRGRLQLLHRGNGRWQPGVVLDGASQVRWDPAGGQALFTRFSHPGLFAWDLSGAPRLLHRQWPAPPRQRSWTLDGNGRAWLLQPRPGCRAGLLPLAGGQGGEARCLGGGRAVVAGGFSVAYDGAALVAEVLQDDSDIAWVELSDTAVGQLSVGDRLLIPKLNLLSSEFRGDFRHSFGRGSWDFPDNGPRTWQNERQV